MSTHIGRYHPGVALPTDPPVRAGPTSRTDGVTPASTMRVRQAYLSHATVGYMTYGLGAATAFIALALGLSDAEAGLHSSAMALGLVAAGSSGERLDRILGERVVHMAAMVALAFGVLSLATAPALEVTLVGAAALGAGDGLLLVFVSRTTTAGGGAIGRARLARSTLASMIAALTASLVIGIGVASGLGWQVYVVPAAGLIGIGVVIARSRGGRRAGPVHVAGRLPRAYWTAWLLTATVVLVEFAVAFWAAAMVVERIDVALEEAAFVLAAFVLGLVLGRGGLSLPLLAGRDPVGLLRAGLLLVALGVLTAWLSPALLVGGLAFVVAGGGLGILFPLSASAAISLAPSRAHLASARVVLAIGVGMFVGPPLVGFTADAVGLLVGWLVVPFACAVALGLTIPVKRLLSTASRA